MARVDDLKALRDNLLTWLDECPPDRKAALVGQYRATLAEIDELSPKEAAVDAIDEIAKRRAARRSAGSASSGRAKQPG